MYKIILLFCVFISSFVNGQQAYDPEKIYSQEQLRNDFEILITALQEGQPGLNRYLSLDSLQFYIEETRLKFNNGLTESEFHLVIREFLAQIKCGHTVAMPSAQFYNLYKGKATLLPLEVYLIDSKLFVRENYSTDTTIAIGDEIIEINGVKASDLILKMNAIQPRDGYSKNFVQHSVQVNFRTYFLFLYGMHSKYSLSIANTKGGVRNIEIKGNVHASNNFAHVYDSTKYQLALRIKDEALYFSKENPTLAILQIKAFQQKDYKKFYKQAFELMAKSQRSELVIDIRGNGGGYFPNASFMLRYLINGKFDLLFYRPKNRYTMKAYTEWDFFSKLTKSLFKLKPDRTHTKGIRTYEFIYKPVKKNHYDGNMYVFIDGGTFSMSSYVAAYLKDRTPAVLLGEETGGGETGSNAILMPKISLPETGVRIFLPYYTIVHNIKTENIGRGVLPHYMIDYSISEYLNSIDLELNQVLNILQKKQVQK